MNSIALETSSLFPLPVLTPAITEWMESLQNGRGFIRERHPIADRTEAEIALFRWGLGPLEMRLEPGEIDSLENDAVLHARTGFEDFDAPAKSVTSFACG